MWHYGVIQSRHCKNDTWFVQAFALNYLVHYFMSNPWYLRGQCSDKEGYFNWAYPSPMVLGYKRGVTLQRVTLGRLWCIWNPHEIGYLEGAHFSIFEHKANPISQWTSKVFENGKELGNQGPWPCNCEGPWFSFEGCTTDMVCRNLCQTFLSSMSLMQVLRYLGSLFIVSM